MFKNAQSVKKELKTASSARAKKEIEMVRRAIEKMIEEEKDHFFLYESLMPSVEQGLRDAGYKLESNSHRNEFTMRVEIP